jgi:membrane protein implicated in regulation of membrane protease activity
MESIDPVILWIAVGFLLVIGEMLTGTFYLLFIALGCFAAAAMSQLQMPFLMQSGMCGLVSVLGVFLLRKPLQKKLLKTLEVHNDLGRTLTIDSTILANKKGSVTYQGSIWSAENVGESSLQSGDQAIIVKIDGNILQIKKN